MQPVRQSAICGQLTNNNTRGVTMKLHHILWLAIVLIIPANVWAYGEGGGMAVQEFVFSGLAKQYKWLTIGIILPPVWFISVSRLR
jgi:hypothetical protein